MEPQVLKKLVDGATNDTHDEKPVHEEKQEHENNETILKEEKEEKEENILDDEMKEKEVTEEKVEEENQQKHELDISLVKQENGISETKSETDEYHMETEFTGRKLSQSAPSSPTRPKIFRSMSDNEKSKRGEQDFEMASILVGLSQAKGPRPMDPNRPVSMTGKSSMFYIPSGYSFLGPRYPNSSHMMHQSRPPFRPHGPPFSQEYVKPFHQGVPTTSGSSSTDKNTSPIVDRTPPPDSPEANRREFVSEQPRREIPRDDKTRVYLQETINKERDRFTW